MIFRFSKTSLSWAAIVGLATTTAGPNEGILAEENISLSSSPLGSRATPDVFLPREITNLRRNKKSKDAEDLFESVDVIDIERSLSIDNYRHGTSGYYGSKSELLLRNSKMLSFERTSSEDNQNSKEDLGVRKPPRFWVR